MTHRYLRHWRLLAALALPAAFQAHAADAPRCTYVDVADIPIRYVGPGLAPAVDGTINGTPATMLADTGAFDTLLTLNAVVRRDLGLFMTGRYVEGVGGSQRLYTTHLQDFAIGPAHSQHGTRVLVEYQEDSQPFDATVGAPFLLQADLEIDLRAKQMRFFRALHCGDTPLLIWNEPTVAVPFENSRDPSPNPHFTVLVNGKALDAIVDTGAHHTILTRRAAERAGIDVNAPGARRLGYMSGTGDERAELWGANIKTFKIGDETIKDAEIGIIDPKGDMSTDVLLGQDFLRAHRVLFAMSQHKLYFAYLGGDAFTRGTGVPAWVRAEADGGNPDAEYALALAYYNGNGVPRDARQGQAWMDKAAGAGQPNARLSVGARELRAGHLDAAIAQLQPAVEQLPANRVGPLWLYLARVRKGDAARAQTELNTNLTKHRVSAWPDPIAEFYLGKLDADGLLGQAARDKENAHARTCMADEFMADWHAAHADQARADALLTTVRADCRAQAAKPAAPVPAPVPKPVPADRAPQGAAP